MRRKGTGCYTQSTGEFESLQHYYYYYCFTACVAEGLLQNCNSLMTEEDNDRKT